MSLPNQPQLRSFGLPRKIDAASLVKKTRQNRPSGRNPYDWWKDVAGQKKRFWSRNNFSVTASRYVFVAHRAWQSVLLVILTTIVTFVLMNLAPGDMVDVMAGEAGSSDPGYMAQLRAAYGLDQPLLVRFFHYLQHIAHLDLGFSFRAGKPVLDLILERLGPTILLMVSAITISIIVAALLGIWSAVKAYGKADRIISIISLIGYATPAFWIGLMAILVFSVKLKWFPSSGMETLFSGFTGVTRILDIARHLALPAITLSLFHLSLFTRLFRTSLIDILRQDFIRTARAKGLSEARVVGVHALGNALLPVVTMVSMQVSALLGGAIVIESVFAWPGLGRLAFEAISQRDTNLLMGIVLCSAVLVTLVNLAVDMFYSWLDPRIERA